MRRALAVSLSLALPALLRGSEVDPLPDGTYLIRLLFVRHGLSCANVPWNACTTNATKVSEEGMGPSSYNDLVERFDTLMRAPNPVSMEGMQKSWGIRPRGWQIPGHSKTADGLSDDCIVKANLASLHDGDYDDFGNLVAVRQLVKDPHVVSCAMAHARAAHDALAPWLASNRIVFDLFASSSLKRAMETALVVFGDGQAQNISVMPYANEMNLGTPYQPENYAYPPDVQARQMSETFDLDIWPERSLMDGEGERYPHSNQQVHKFKAILAMEVLPWLARRSAGEGATTMEPNPEIVRALEEGRAAGHPVFPVHTTPDTPLLQSFDAGDLRYEQGATLSSEDYFASRAAGAQEFVVGMGSHMFFLRTFCGYTAEESGPNNLEVLERLIEVRVSSQTSSSGTRHTTFTVRDDGPRCELILQSPTVPIAELSASDLGEACTTPFDVASVMDLMPEPSNGSTPCVAAADASHFTIRAGQLDITSEASLHALPAARDASLSDTGSSSLLFLTSCFTFAVGAIAVRMSRSAATRRNDELPLVESDSAE